MFVQPALFKVLALSVAAVILALTPASTLVYWVEGGSEIIHSSPAYTVVYKPSFLDALTRSNDTTLKIEVRDERGRPLTFAALLSGPTSDSVIEVGRVSGKGYAVKSIGKYVAEVRKVLMKANSDPERSGMGMLILLSTIIEEDGEYYAAADAVSIPIIPGKAVGKEIVATIKFKPIMKFKVKDEGGSGRQPQGPSATIIERCDVGSEIYYCYLWELSEVLYTTPIRTTVSGNRIVETEWDYIPVAITKLDNSLGSKQII
ncbi:MAG: hypothetical protein P3X22_003075 [Thermoprotei archaeon]|nr:hypothetical protein [Thermoprotei archaeon]